jgi:type II secretion system protein N
MSPDGLRRLRRIGGTAGFGLAVFAVAFVFSFPFERIKDLAVAYAAAQNLDVEIGGAGPTWGLGVAFSEVKVQTRPADGKKPSRFLVESASVRVSPLAQLLGRFAFSVDAETMGGEIDADIDSSRAKGIVKIETRKISMAELPGVREAINLPLAGSLDLLVDMTFPQNKNAESGGAVSWKCAACALGDGKEKLKVAGNPLLAEGISLPRIRLGDFRGRITFEKGLGKLQAVQAKSPDGELMIEGEVRLADPVRFSSLDLYVRFKMSDALLKSSDKLKLLLQFAESAGKRPDGHFGFRLTGTMAKLGPMQWMKTSPFTGGAAGARPPAGRSSAATARPAAEPAPVAETPPPPPPAETVVDPAQNPSANVPQYATEPIQAAPPAASD